MILLLSMNSGYLPHNIAAELSVYFIIIRKKAIIKPSFKTKFNLRQIPANRASTLN